MKILALTALLFITPGPASAAPPANYLGEPPPARVRLNEVVTFKARHGYHFNLEAEQDCGRGTVLAASTGAVKCQFKAGGEQSVVLKLCSEKNPMCLFEEFTLKVLGAAAAGKGKGAAPLPEEPGLPGFILNRPEAALKAAREGGKLLFIDFFAKWCPSCRLMEDTALIDPAFLEASAGMVRLSLDVDMPVSREWLSRFRIGGYPTFIVVDSRLREIGRVEGSLSPGAFSRWVTRQQAWKDSPIEAARASAASLDEAGKIRVARSYMSAREWARARELLAGSADPRRDYLAEQCRIAEAEAAGSAELPSIYKAAIERYSGSGGGDAEIGAVDWIAALHKADPAAAKPWVEGIEALAGRLAASAGVREDGYLPSEIYVAIGDALGGAGLGGLSLDFYGRAAGEYAAMAAAAPRPESAKGLRMCAARYLSLARRYDEAAASYASLTSDYPSEYAFRRSYSGTLRRMKKYPEALREAAAAADLSYGDIRLDILLMKAEIELESGDKAGAIRTADAAMASADLPGDPKLRTHGAYRRLKEFRSKAAAAN